MARDATPRRRSARLSKSGRSNASPRKTPLSNKHLSAVLERDETPEAGGQASIDNVMSTPNVHQKVTEQLSELSKLRTPNTEPCPAKEQMHPETVHQTTTKAPDSGLKLGFADISASHQSLESKLNTPTRPQRQSVAKTNIPPTYQFKFNREANLSHEGKKMMDSIREDAAKIKAQMQAEKELQDERDDEAEQMLQAGSSRKIAKPKSKIGRYSDVHMEQFKKMASIENHASAFRAKPGFAQPTGQSLKRSSSKADLDSSERPRTSVKSPLKPSGPQIIGKAASISPFKSIKPPSPKPEQDTPAKRMRCSSTQDVSTARPKSIPRPVSSRLMSPTKSSLARSTSSKTQVSPNKLPALSRSNSTRSINPGQTSFSSLCNTAAGTSPLKPSKLPNISKPLPELPESDGFGTEHKPLERSISAKSTSIDLRKDGGTASKLPTLAGLRSILRSKPLATTSRGATPKKSKTVTQTETSPKKVDFTPSVKSRYAVKLAATSPSPAKVDRVQTPSESALLYDSSAYVIEDNDDNSWTDEDTDVVYPTLPVEEGPRVNTFAQKAKDLGRRESQEFRSIFTNLHPSKESNSITLTAVNTNLNKTDPVLRAAQITQSPRNKPSTHHSSTIRPVRTSSTYPIIPYEDEIQTVPHGLPGKKRRYETSNSSSFEIESDAKENRRSSIMPSVPGAWQDSVLEQDEGDKRGGKRARVDRSDEPKKTNSQLQKTSTSREMAAKNAKDRKSKTPGGILSFSRLNILARPKQ